jgi:hypothetical protein
MGALLFLILPLPNAVFFHFNLFKILGGLSFGIHSGGLRWLEHHPSKWQWLYQSVLLGEKLSLSNLAEAESFSVLGLYQLLVMTGIILSLSDQLLLKVFYLFEKRTSRALRALILLSLVALNDFHPGLVRWYVFWFLRHMIKSFSLYSDEDLFLITLSICLTLSPDWISSLAFLFSCAAHLGLLISKSCEFQKKKFQDIFFRSALFTLLASPFIFSLRGTISWLVLILGGFSLLFFQWVFFPLILLGALVPKSRFFSEKLIEQIFFCASEISKFRKPEFVYLNINSWSVKQWGFPYIIFSYLFWRFSLLVYRRKRFQKNQISPTRI